MLLLFSTSYRVRCSIMREREHRLFVVEERCSYIQTLLIPQRFSVTCVFISLVRNEMEGELTTFDTQLSTAHSG